MINRNHVNHFTIYRLLLTIQGLYTLITALWAIIDIDSFMVVTGPKTDIWLVKTVSVVLVAVALSLLAHLNDENPKLPAIILGAATAIGLSILDFYYSGKNVIRLVYAADGVAEVIFFIGWLIVYRTFHSRNPFSTRS